MLDRLDGDDAEHFAAVRALLDHAGVSYEVDATLVRGLDYYTRTVFEFHCERLGAQSQVAGGGRYDGLIELLGGPATPGAAAGPRGSSGSCSRSSGAEATGAADVFVAAPDDQRERAFALVRELRSAGLRAELDLAGRSLKGQMKQADRIGARSTVILDDDGAAQLRDMASGEQRELDLAEAAEELAR